MAKPEAFPDHKVLELLLFYVFSQGDTNALAHTLLEQFGSLAGVMDAIPDELIKVPGTGMRTAVLLKAVKEAGRRYLTQLNSTDKILSSTEKRFKVLRPYFYGARNEMSYVLCMDGKYKLLGVRKVGEGNVNSVELKARAIFEAALSLNTVKLVMAHNHVSGIAFPSPEDRQTTKYYQDILRHVGIELVDHMIFVNDDMLSFKDSGYIEVEE